ncbi:hypothetical protein [uncultured Mailhella sp.]|uniref:hypothetical protein n=1 Tax=uncultured Mailhella sp. TaxID=1981031 RepID=UPI00261F7E4A|nr:hypothetical protein [uncultured Mailhella sp.]
MPFCLFTLCPIVRGQLAISSLTLAHTSPSSGGVTMFAGYGRTNTSAPCSLQLAAPQVEEGKELCLPVSRDTP